LKQDERNTLEAILVVSESINFNTKSVTVYTDETAIIFVNELIKDQIPKWVNSREFSIKKTQLSGLFFGWVTSALISIDRYKEFEKRLNIAICNRIRELLD